ncbi:MAG: AAA family ATPase [Thermomicrobiales bacterium]
MTITDEQGLSVAEFRDITSAIENEVGNIMVGQREVVREVLICIIAGGHALLEGVPGLGKTLLVRTFANSLHLKFNRIQFTPDLMPADITGTNILVESEAGERSFAFQPGPIFSNLVLADEINRATPKTQAALLESMQDRTCSVAGVIHPMLEPFFVLATQNPIEMEGTYPLPEAQLDRFLFKLIVSYPSETDLTEILRITTADIETRATPVADGHQIVRLGKLARQVPIASSVTDYVVRLVMATHPENTRATEGVKRYVRFGVSPRGAQAIVLGSKIRALMEGRLNVAFDDIRAVALPALRHRIILNFEAESSGVSTDDVLISLLAEVPESSV